MFTSPLGLPKLSQGDVLNYPSQRVNELDGGDPFTMYTCIKSPQDTLYFLFIFHIVHFKYSMVLYVHYTSVKLKKKKPQPSHWASKMVFGRAEGQGLADRRVWLRGEVGEVGTG